MTLMSNSSNKTLEIGHDYASTMQCRPGTKAIYNGGISWTMSGGGREQTADSQALTDKTIAYISQSSVKIG